MVSAGYFRQKNRTRSLDKALAKALLLFRCGSSLADPVPRGQYFRQKNRARSLDKALTKALLLFRCNSSLTNWVPVVNDYFQEGKSRANELVAFIVFWLSHHSVFKGV